jgi:hypothetical protein
VKDAPEGLIAAMTHTAVVTSFIVMNHDVLWPRITLMHAACPGSVWNDGSKRVEAACTLLESSLMAGSTSCPANVVRLPVVHAGM